MEQVIRCTRFTRYAFERCRYSLAVMRSLITATEMASSIVRHRCQLVKIDDELGHGSGIERGGEADLGGAGDGASGGRKDEGPLTRSSVEEFGAQLGIAAVADDLIPAQAPIGLLAAPVPQ